MNIIIKVPIPGDATAAAEKPTFSGARAGPIPQCFQGVRAVPPLNAARRHESDPGGMGRGRVPHGHAGHCGASRAVVGHAAGFIVFPGAAPRMPAKGADLPCNGPREIPGRVPYLFGSVHCGASHAALGDALEMLPYGDVPTLPAGNIKISHVRNANYRKNSFSGGIWTFPPCIREYGNALL